jgi:hypothetical protein
MSDSFPDRIQLDEGHVTFGVRWFVTLAPFRQISSHGVITVPRHFLTDGASIPRAFWSIAGPFGKYFGAALVHDYLYSKDAAKAYPHITRKIADEIFLEGMFNLGVPWYQRNPMHRAVRMFGGRSYRKR